MKWWLVGVIAICAHAAQKPFAIHVVDSITGRGVPLVELRTASQRAWYTDSNGVAAISDSWCMGREVFFQIHSHGYTFEETGIVDGPGKKLLVESGGRVVLRIRRDNLAERMYRITGAGIYADSVELGLPVSIREPLLNAKVTGQDTAVSIPYRGRIYWFWGDTHGPANWNFNVAGATSAMQTDPERGIDLDYFKDANGFAKTMLPIDRPGPVWIEGLMTVRDATGRDRLVATYTRVKDLSTMAERGVAAFDDTANEFRVLAQFEGKRGHRSSHPVRIVENGKAWWYLYPTYRVADDWNAIQREDSYEAWVCEGSTCNWKAGARFVPAGDVGSIAWNAYRKKWVSISGAGGDVYYAEAERPVGPWTCRTKVVTHDHYNFYNPVHHGFFDRDGGRIIYFEGTYTKAFVNGGIPTPLYDYNQILCKLSLDGICRN
jgi:hypothetical protein